MIIKHHNRYTERLVMLHGDQDIFRIFLPDISPKQSPTYPPPIGKFSLSISHPKISPSTILIAYTSLPNSPPDQLRLHSCLLSYFCLTGHLTVKYDYNIINVLFHSTEIKRSFCLS